MSTEARYKHIATLRDNQTSRCEEYVAIIEIGVVVLRSLL